MMRTSYLAVADVAASLLAHPAVARAWDQPSALERYAVSGLAGHLAGQINVVAKVLAGQPTTTDPISAIDYLLQARWLDADQDGDAHRGIRASGDEYAAAGPQAMAAFIADVLDGLHRTLPALPADAVVQFPWGPPAMSLDDLLLNRMMELVVHVDDLAVSVGLSTPELPVEATDAVVSVLSALAARRHGAIAVIRALARTERAPATIAAF